MRLSAVGLGAIALLATAPLAQAEDTPAWKSCVATTNAGAERFASCTEVIDSKFETGRRLAAAYCIRGHENNEKRELDAALADLDEAIRLDPTYACSYNNRGRTYAFKGDYDRAIADYGEALELDHNMFIAYNNRGDAYFRKRQLDEAIADFSMALTIAPNYARAYGNRVLAYHAMRDYKRAAEDYTAQFAWSRRCLPISAAAMSTEMQTSSTARWRTTQRSSSLRPTMRAVGATAA